MNDYQILKDTLAKGYTENVIKTLKELTHNLPTFNNDVVLLSSRFELYRQKKNRGIQSDAVLTVELNQIHDSILDIINQLPQSHLDMAKDNDQLKPLVTSLYDLIKVENNIQITSNKKDMDTLTTLLFIGGKLIEGFFSASGEKAFNSLTNWITAKDNTPAPVAEQITAIEEKNFEKIDLDALKNAFVSPESQSFLSEIKDLKSLTPTAKQDFLRDMKSYIKVSREIDALQQKIDESTDARDTSEYERQQNVKKERVKKLEINLKAIARELGL
jgi:Effector-associated domain 11